MSRLVQVMKKKLKVSLGGPWRMEMGSSSVMFSSWSLVLSFSWTCVISSSMP